MTLRVPSWALLVGASAIAAPVARAQTVADWLGQGMRAYERLDYAVAAAFFRRQLGAAPASAQADSDRATALMYLGASEVFRGHEDSAVAAFRQLILLRPVFQPSQLTFPPEVSTLFRRVRADTRALAIEVARTTALEVGQAHFTARLSASAYQSVEVAIASADARPVRLLYAGPIGDSLSVTWDGRDGGGAVVTAGTYWLRVTSHAPSGEPLRIIQLVLTVQRHERDTVPLPPPPPDSLFRPERAPAGPALIALGRGALISGAVVALPALAANGAPPMRARFVVAGAIGVSGLAAFFARRPGRPVEENVRANERVRAAWQQRVELVKRDNAARRRVAWLTLDAGPPQVIEQRAP